MKSCSYIIHDDRVQDCFLVDCGDSDKIMTYIKENHLTLKGIFLTHCHYDHIYGMNMILSNFPQCTVYGSKDSMDGLYNPKINLSEYNGIPFTLSYTPFIEILSSDSNISLLGQKIKIYETPGHDSGCISYQVGNYLFTGDSYIPFAPVFARWKRSCKSKAILNEQKLKDYAADKGLHILCGHYK